MHTLETITATFHYNSDLSGKVIIVRNGFEAKDDITIEVSGKDIIELIMNYLRNEEISNLEQMNTSSLLARYTGSEK